jgi:hypothetical protein
MCRSEVSVRRPCEGWCLLTAVSRDRGCHCRYMDFIQQEWISLPSITSNEITSLEATAKKTGPLHKAPVMTRWVNTLLTRWLALWITKSLLSFCSVLFNDTVNYQVSTASVINGWLSVTHLGNGNEIAKKRNIRRETCSQCTSPSTNPTRFALRSDPLLRGERPAATILSHGMVQVITWWANYNILYGWAGWFNANFFSHRFCKKDASTHYLSLLKNIISCI